MMQSEQYWIDRARHLVEVFEQYYKDSEMSNEQPAPEYDSFKRGYEQGLNDTIRNGVQWARQYFGATASSPTLSLTDKELDALWVERFATSPSVYSVCGVCQGEGRIYQGCDSWIHCSQCNTTGKVHQLCDEAHHTERAAFNQWQRDYFGPLTTKAELRVMWDVWQARASIARNQAEQRKAAISAARKALQCSLAYGLQDCDEWVRDEAENALRLLDALDRSGDST